MPLHFVQVERELIEGPDPDEIGGRLKLSRFDVIGRINCMLAWSLDYAAPDGIVYGSSAMAAIERAAGWTGKRGRWGAEMISVGILEEITDGVRFKGWVERYGKALTDTEKARIRKRRQRARQAGRHAESHAPEEPSNPNVTRDMGRDNGRDDIRDTPRDPFLEAIETRKENLKPPPPEPVAVDEFPPGIEELPPTRAGCWEFIQRERERHGLAREDSPPPGFARWHDDAVAEHGPGGVARALGKYLADSHFADRDWPTAVFITPGVFAHRARSAG